MTCLRRVCSMLYCSIVGVFARVWSRCMHDVFFFCVLCLCMLWRCCDIVRRVETCSLCVGRCVSGNVDVNAQTVLLVCV